MATFQLEVVSATRMVWEGEAESLIARTTEGDIGILSNHQPLIAMLIPCVVESVAADGRSDTFVVDGGFLSVADNRVSVMSQYAQLAEEISLDAAERERGSLRKVIEAGDADDDIMHRYHRVKAQIAAARRYQERIDAS